jgi:glutathione S-transferase
MDFYHTPTSCSQATHILLREAKLDFRPHKVDIFSRTLEDGSDYAQVNPNEYVPALMLDDGMLLTENVAIIDWIASRSPDLLPDGRLGRTRHLQMLAFLSTEVHKPFIPLFFLEDEAEQARLRAILVQRLSWIARRSKAISCSATVSPVLTLFSMSCSAGRRRSDSRPLAASKDLWKLSNAAAQ